MATKLFLRDSNTSGGTTGTDAMHDLSKSAGTVKVAYVINTVTGAVTPPTAATQWTKTGGGTVCTFLTAPLVGLTISGAVTFNLWAFESATTANGTITAELYRCDSTGAIVSTIASATLSRTELGTSAAANNWLPTVTSRTLSTGDRLGVRVFMDDGSAVTMASAKTMTMDIDGPTGAADGDSWVQVTETLAFAYTAAQAQSMALSESTASKFAAAAGQAQALALSESSASKFAGNAGQAQSLSLAESTASKFAAATSQAQSLTLAASTVASQALPHVSNAEALAIAESTASKLAARSTQAQSMTAAEGSASRFAANAAQAQSLAIGEARASKLAAAATQAQSLGLSESSATKLATLVAQSQSTTLAASLAVQLAAIASPAESLSIAESLAAAVATQAALSESAALLESVSAQLAAVIAISEATVLSEGTAAAIAANANLAESLTVAEARASLFAASAALAESIAAVESLDVSSSSGGSSFHEHPSETASIGESVAAAVRLGAVVSESLAIGEAVVATCRAAQRLTDALALGATISVADTSVVVSPPGHLSVTLIDGSTLTMEVAGCGRLAVAVTPSSALAVALIINNREITMSQFIVGQKPRFLGTFKNASNAKANPGNVYFRVQAPDGTTTTYQYGVDNELVKLSDGVYYYELLVTTPGRWTWAMWSTGSVVDAKDGYFVARAARV